MSKPTIPDELNDINATVFDIEDYIGGNIEGVKNVDRMALTVFLRAKITKLISKREIEARLDERRIMNKERAQLTELQEGKNKERNNE